MIARFYIVCSLFFVSVSPAFSQWDNAGIPVTAYQVRTLCHDTVTNRIYAGGLIAFGGSTQLNLNSLWYIQNGNWYSTDTLNNLIKSITIYNNEVYVGGDFTMVNSTSMPYLVKWDGATWTHIGGGNINGNILNLKVINGELIVMGTFSQIGGIAANGIAKYNGSSWSDLNNFPTLFFGGSVADACIYNSDWYVGGNFITSTDTIRDLVVYKNGVWEKVGTNDFLKGSFTSLSALEVYHNELYACGLINKSDGNIGHGIQKWNGMNWNPVGTGFKNQFYNTTGNMSAWDMIIYNDELYVTGGFFYAGDIPMKGIAIWNGDRWCGNSSTNIPNIAQSILILNDTIYLTSNDTIDGNYMNRLAYWPGGNYSDSCSMAMSIDELEVNTFTVYPNPATNFITLKFNSEHFQEGFVSIFSLLGEQVLMNEVSNNTGEFQLEIGNLRSGVYFISYTNGVNTYMSKFLKQ